MKADSVLTFSSSKTKGLFAGVSLEGSIIVERKDANAKFYRGPVSKTDFPYPHAKGDHLTRLSPQVTARQLLSGNIAPPPEADVLLRVLSSRVFSGGRDAASDQMYNDIPQYDDRRDDFGWRDSRGESSRTMSAGSDGSRYSSTAPRSPITTRARAATWNEDHSYRARPDPATTFDSIEESVNRQSQYGRHNYPATYSDNPPSQNSSKGPPPGRPTAPKPVFKPRSATVRSNQAVALYTFQAAQSGDLGSLDYPTPLPGSCELMQLS